MATIDPVDHYQEHSELYDRIGQKVEATTDAFAEADRQLQEMLLNQAVSFALISAQTSVDIHEKGYINVLDADSHSEIEDGLLEAGVNYYRNKAKYIFYNMTEPDYDRVLNHYEAGEIDQMHRAIADEFKGVGLRKAAFAMAKVVTTDKMCVDTHVAQQAGIDSDDIYNGVVVEKYENQCDRVVSNWPELRERLGQFLFQWVVFDAHMETVTTHDPWFLSLPEPVRDRF